MRKYGVVKKKGSKTAAYALKLKKKMYQVLFCVKTKSCIKLRARKNRVDENCLQQNCRVHPQNHEKMAQQKAKRGSHLRHTG